MSSMPRERQKEKASMAAAKLYDSERHELIRSILLSGWIIAPDLRLMPSKDGHSIELQRERRTFWGHKWRAIGLMDIEVLNVFSKSLHNRIEWAPSRAKAR